MTTIIYKNDHIYADSCVYISDYFGNEFQGKNINKIFKHSEYTYTGCGTLSIVTMFSNLRKKKRLTKYKFCFSKNVIVCTNKDTSHVLLFENNELKCFEIKTFNIFSLFALHVVINIIDVDRERVLIMGSGLNFECAKKVFHDHDTDPSDIIKEISTKDKYTNDKVTKELLVWT